MSIFEAVLSGMRDGVLVLDSAGVVAYANQALADIFAAPLNDILNRRLLEAVRLVELSELVEEVQKNKGPQEKELKVFYPIEKNILASVNIIKETNGEELGVGVVLRDVTEMRRLENLRSEFVANVSHELKTPLTAIHGFAETLLNGAMGDKDHNVEFVEKIEKHAKNLSVLIDDLLEISQLESRRGPGDFAPINVPMLIDRAIEMIAEKARKKEVALSVACADQGLEIFGVEEHVYRALLNLLDNAVKYTEAGGSVVIACARGKGQVSISVSDTGIGIAAAHLPRLFERFYRIDKARSRDLGGTGLGLSIVKHVMNLHNGSVSVESEEGKGSIFTLVFTSSKA